MTEYADVVKFSVAQHSDIFENIMLVISLQKVFTSPCLMARLVQVNTGDPQPVEVHQAVDLSDHLH